ncbi:MAG: hypothetical protein LBK61_05410 [Spirochaetaceae bacterium]|nr:hypothetical protein [Spirochaetaceae bacterium]
MVHRLREETSRTARTFGCVFCGLAGTMRVIAGGYDGPQITGRDLTDRRTARTRGGVFCGLAGTMRVIAGGYNGPQITRNE